MKSLLESFKNKLKQGEPVVGPFMKSGDPAFIEAAGYAGFDFIILDREHGPVSVEGLQNLIRGAQCGGVLPFVRVPCIDDNEISKVLDIGAMGVQVPMVSSADDVERALKAARFAPNGERGVCRFVRAAHYSVSDRYGYFRDADDLVIIVQLEGTEAIQNLDEILAVPGIDIVFIGPYDLSQSLGLTGQVNHPDVVVKMQEIVDKARQKGICVGTFADTVEAARKWIASGVQYMSYSVDVGLFAECCQNTIKNILD